MYDPELYRLLHTGNPGDVAFYRRMCPPATTVLELGCGYGRIALALVRSGAEVTGVDHHDGLLALLEADAASLTESEHRRLRTVRADMRRYDLDAEFDKIIIPYNGLLCMLTDTDIVTCFETAAHHLKPDGELIFDIYHIPLFDKDNEPEDESYEHIATLEVDHRVVHVFERSLPNSDPKRFDTAYRYITEDENPLHETEHIIEQRCIFLEDLPTLLGRAGLRIVSLTADFADAPVSDETDQMVVRARLL